MEKTFNQLLTEHVEFTSSTFPKATADGAITHFFRELDEIKEDVMYRSHPDKLSEECADALGCYVDFCNRIGVTPEMLINAFDKKLTVNKGRKWKDNGDGSYSHIKTTPTN